ncbi:MAG TPA: hypothetical protein VIG25_08930 [Pyrinomonadaceae bacterium]|jgi:hypothetical protein
MKPKSLLFVFSMSLTLGAIGCKTSADSTVTAQSAPHQNVVTAQEVTSSAESKSENASENKTEPPSYTADPEPPPPPPSSKGLTREVMKNVNFHADDLVVYDIRTIRGSLLRRYKSKPPIFDDKRSFILNIDSAVIGVRMDTMANLMNSYVFAYPGAPLKNFRFSIDGNQLKATGSVHKMADLPFEVKAILSATSDGKIRIHPTSIKTAGLPVKGFLHLFGVEMDDVIRAKQARGLRIDDNDLILDPEQMSPPPMIRGKVTAVQIVGDEVIMIFGGRVTLSEGEIARLANSRSGGNYVHYRGGMLRFGKLTMTNSDLKIVDSNPRDPFDFSIDHYSRQMVAGYAKPTPRYGLVAYVPDYYRLQNTSPKAISGRANNKPSP